MTSDLQPARPAPSRLDLFLGFGKLGLMGFGGVLPFARRELVETRGWLSAAEFADLLGLCQFLPGGNIANLSIAVGYRFYGISGAASAICGLLLAPAIIVFMIGEVYDRFRDLPVTRHMFAGIAAGAGGLLLALAFKIAEPLRKDLRGLLVLALVFGTIGVLHWPLLPLLFILLAVSLVLNGGTRR